MQDEARSWVAWIGPIAARAVNGSGLHGRNAEQVPLEELSRATAIVLTAAEVEALRRWRSRGLVVPAVVVAAMADVIEQRAALEPIAWARPDTDLRVALERFARSRARPRLVLGPVRVDLENLTVTGAKSERLTAMEGNVLAYLAGRRGRVVPTEELLREVWGYTTRNTNTVPVIIGRVRKKIEIEPRKPLWLLTSRGNGYRLVHAPVTTPVTTLAGRDDQLRVATARLQAEGALWISGWAGIGKSRFVRTLMLDRSPLQIDLSGVTDPEQALRAMAHGVGRNLAGPGMLDPALSSFGSVVLDQADEMELDDLYQLCRRWTLPTVVVRRRGPDGALELGRMAPEHAAEWLQARAARDGKPLPKADAVRLAEATAGIPLAMQLVAPLLSSMTLEDLEGALTGAPPDQVEASVHQAHEQLEPSAQRTLALLSALGGPVSLSLLGFLSAGAVLQLHTLEQHGWVDIHAEQVAVPALVRAALGTTPPIDLEERLQAWSDGRRSMLLTPEGGRALSELAAAGALLRSAWKRATPGNHRTCISLALHEVITAFGRWEDRLELARATVEGTRGPERGRALVVLARVLERDPGRVEVLLDEALELLPIEAHDAVRLQRAVAGSVLDRSDRWLHELDMLQRSTDPVVALQARARASWLRYLHADLDESTLIDRKLGTSRRLLELGDPIGATDQLVEAVGMLRLTDAPRCLPAVRAQHAVLQGLHAPRSRIRTAIAMAELIQEVEQDHQAAMATLAHADALAVRFEPSLLGQIEGIRGTLAWDAGNHTSARRSLQRNLEREQAAERSVAILSVLLDLAGLEADIGDGRAAHHWLDRAQALGLDRYRPYVLLERGTADALLGRWREALEHFEAARTGSLNGACALSLALRALAACTCTGSPADGWSAWLESILPEVAGRLSTDATDLWAAFEHGEVERFAPKTGLNRVDRRLLLEAQRAKASS